MGLKLLRYFFWLPALVFWVSALAEGTKQIQPAAEKPCKLDILNPNATRFASYMANPNERLQIRISNPQTERIYFGFGIRFTGNTVPETSNVEVYYRIKDPAGNVVAGPFLLNDTGPGYIASFGQAVAGPALVAGPDGYNALSFQPSVAGDYSIEFNANHPEVFNNVNFRFDLFDISVVNTAVNRAIDGRLWSRTWDLSTLDFTNKLYAKIFVYTPDGVVTSVDYNGMQPFGYTVVANSTGLTDSGDGLADRKSSNEKELYPEYPIFLNDPDPAVYPSGAPAVVTAGPAINRSANGEFCVNVTVSRPISVELLLDLNGQTGYQSNSADVLVVTSLATGENCIPWDGKNGQGNPLATGAAVNGSLKVLTGLVNLPVYDVENHTDGFIITLHRPINGRQVKVFYDDTNVQIVDKAGNVLVTGTANLDGCTDPAGCHRWTKNFDATNTATHADGGQVEGFGDEKTINTWWTTEEETRLFALVVPPVLVTPAPIIGLAKTASAPVKQADGSYEVTYTFTVKNMGNVLLKDVQVTDNLASAFPAPATFSLRGAPVTTGTLAANPSFNGLAVTGLLNSSQSTLAVGATGTVTVTLLLRPNGSTGPFLNTAIAIANDPTQTPVQDVSTPGNNPDPNNNNNPGDPGEDKPAELLLPVNPVIGVAKAVARPVEMADRSYDITYTLAVKNYGTISLNRVQVTDDLLSTFPAPAGFVVKNVSATGTLTANPAFNGSDNRELLIASGSSLAVGQSATVTFTVNVSLNGTTQKVFYNTAVGSGKGTEGPETTDLSTPGSNPDPNNNGNPDEVGENAPTPVTLDPLRIPEGFSPNGDQAHDTFFIHGVSELVVNIQIYNRWGNLVYQKNNYKNDWDGRSNASGLRVNDQLPDGTYYYIIKLSDNRKFAGYLTLAR